MTGIPVLRGGNGKVRLSLCKLYSIGSCSSTSSYSIREKHFGGAASAAHQDLLGLLRNPETVVSVKLGKLLKAEQAGRLKLVIRLKQKTQSQGIPLGMEKVSQHHN